MAYDDDGYRTDIEDRKVMVKQLHEQTGTDMKRRKGRDGKKEPCMSFSEYLRLLRIMHESGRARELNGHFCPQNENCFRHSYPSEWFLVTTINDLTLPTKFAEAIGLNMYQTSMGHDHRSTGSTGACRRSDGIANTTTTTTSSFPARTSKSFPMTDDDAKLLDILTLEETGILSEVLSKQS